MVVVGIGKEHRLDVGIVHTHMFHAVFLLVATCELVLLDDAIQIVRHVSTHHQSVLRLAVHGLRIDVVILLLVLHQPTLVLKHLEILDSFLVNTRVVLVGARLEIDFRLDDVIQ